ncbi:MAG: polyprenyl synthetase family protein [Oscillospiraceae bacterium]|nr:polyprenyl synthetase family protein [Oscillospiraceae bacterium]
MDYGARYKRYADMVEEALTGGIETLGGVSELAGAMKYSLLAGGKRIRPVVLLAFAEACGGNLEHALPFACGLEMIHTCSLIHDDMPCMDDDDMRRGRPTNHIVYGDAMALLAGDGLLTLAFEVMLEPGHFKLKGGADARRAAGAAYQIALGTGERGMTGGQALDITASCENATIERLTATDELKTCGLFSAAARAGCVIAGAGGALVDSAGRYGLLLGLTFQIVDDILDVEGDPSVTGKTAGTDAKLNKPTYMSMLGSERCRARARELTEQAANEMNAFGSGGDFLRELAQKALLRVQ